MHARSYLWNTRLQGLAQHFEHVALELRQFIQEEHAVVGQRHLAGHGDVAAAGAAEAVYVVHLSRISRDQTLIGGLEFKALFGRFDGRSVAPGYLVDHHPQSETAEPYVRYPPHAEAVPRSSRPSSPWGRLCERRRLQEEVDTLKENLLRGGTADDRTCTPVGDLSLPALTVPRPSPMPHGMTCRSPAI